MTNNVTKEFLQEHFRKHDSITLYKPDGTAVTFRKQYNLVVKGGGFRGDFKTYVLEACHQCVRLWCVTSFHTGGAGQIFVTFHPCNGRGVSRTKVAYSKG